MQQVHSQAQQCRARVWGSLAWVENGSGWQERSHGHRWECICSAICRTGGSLPAEAHLQDAVPAAVARALTAAAVFAGADADGVQAVAAGVASMAVLPEASKADCALGKREASTVAESDRPGTAPEPYAHAGAVAAAAAAAAAGGE